MNDGQVQIVYDGDGSPLTQTTSRTVNGANMLPHNVSANRMMESPDLSPLILNAVKTTSTGTLSTTLSRSLFFRLPAARLDSRAGEI